MPRKPEILEACQDYGLVLGKTLIEYAGWQFRGSDSFDPKGSVNHHTAGSRVGDLPSIQTLVNGRDDLPGPLCNAAESRSGNIHLIAAGKANHAGLGGWNGLTGNSSVWGLEVEHYGYPDEPVSEKQWDTMYRWHAACMDVSGQSNASLVCQHFEWAPTRKVDFVKQLIVSQGGVKGFRLKVAAKDPQVPQEPGDDDDMFTYDYKSGTTTVLIQVASGKQTRINGNTLSSNLRGKDTHIGEVDQTMYDRYKKQYGEALGM